MKLKLGILACLLCVLAWTAAVQWHRRPVQTIDPSPVRKQWFDVGDVTALDSSFLVQGWKGFASGSDDATPAGVRKALAGEFAADQPALLMLLDGKNFERLQQGFPPLPLATFEAGKVSADIPGGKTWLVFFQKPPRQADDAFPTTGLQLGLVLLKRLQESSLPPMHVTARLTTTFSAFASPVEAATLRSQFRHAASHVRQSAQLPPDRTPPARPSQARPQRSQPFGTPIPPAPDPAAPALQESR